jgi:hypothetical protein
MAKLKQKYKIPSQTISCISMLLPLKTAVLIFQVEKYLTVPLKGEGGKTCKGKKCK